MIITTSDGRLFDTDKDLTAPERHALQKLFLWEALAGSIEQFRNEKAKALERGWDKSGRLAESSAMRLITADMEKRLMARLQDKSS
jgi:hypothetical protein